MTSESEIRDLIYKTSECEIVNWDFTNELTFSAEIRAKLDADENGKYMKSVNEWVRKFSELTKTHWIVGRTKPNLVKFNYRKDFLCQHAGKNKTLLPKSKKPRARGRNRECPANIIIVIRKSTKNTCRSDPLMKQGLNARIKLEFRHTHQIHNAEAYSFLKYTSEIRAVFDSYFSNGLTPVGAKAYHELFVISTNERHSMPEITRMLADPQMNPTIRQVYQFFESWKESHLCHITDAGMAKAIRDKQSFLSLNGTTILVEDEPFCVVIVTAMMRRAHSLNIAQEFVYVESRNTCEQGSTSCVTILFGMSKVGAVPLGVIIHKSLTVDDYFRGFGMLTAVLGAQAFNQRPAPLAFMIGDIAALANALRRFYPSSKVFLSGFHLSRSVWRALCESSTNCNESYRAELLIKFRNMMYTYNMGLCNDIMREILSNAQVAEHYPKFYTYVEALNLRTNEWCVSWRQDMPVHDFQTLNVVESSIRFFNDLVLDRCKAFNAVAFTDFVVYILDEYYKNHFIRCAKPRKKQRIHFYLYCQKGINASVNEVSDNTFCVEFNGDIQMYEVVTHSDFEFCNCPAGRNAEICKHICATHVNFNITQNIPPISAGEGDILAKLALGSDYDPRILETSYEDKYDENKLEESFFVSMDATNNATCDSVGDACVYDEYDESRELRSDDNDKNVGIDENVKIDRELIEPMKDEINSLKKNLNSLMNLFEKYPNGETLKNAKFLNRQLSTVKRVSDINDLCMCLKFKKKCAGRNGKEDNVSNSDNNISKNGEISKIKNKRKKKISKKYRRDSDKSWESNNEMIANEIHSSEKVEKSMRSCRKNNKRKKSHHSERIGPRRLGSHQRGINSTICLWL